MAKQIVGVAGSLSGVSKTHVLVETVLDRVQRATGAVGRIIPLHTLAPQLGAATSREDMAPELKAALRAVENADLLVVGSPVYKGSYTGLFKYFFDYVDFTALQGKPVALTATGGGDRHALVVEHQLRPLFGFFSAHALPTGFYASDRDFNDGFAFSAAQSARLDQLVNEAIAVLEPSRAFA